MAPIKQFDQGAMLQFANDPDLGQKFLNALAGGGGYALHRYCYGILTLG